MYVRIYCYFSIITDYFEVTIAYDLLLSAIKKHYNSSKIHFICSSIYLCQHIIAYIIVFMLVHCYILLRPQILCINLIKHKLFLFYTTKDINDIYVMNSIKIKIIFLDVDSNQSVCLPLFPDGFEVV